MGRPTIPVLRMISAGSIANSNSNVRSNVNKRALILQKRSVREGHDFSLPGSHPSARLFCERERRDYMIDALDNRETVAYACVRARNKRRQVSIDARERLYRVGNIIPSLRPTTLLPLKKTQTR